MTLVLNGTSGLSDVDGSAATPAIRGTDANTGIFFPAADTIAFSEGGVEALRLDSSGNMGLGVTPSAWGGSYKGFQVAATGVFASNGSNGTVVAHNAYYDGTNDKYLTTGAASRVFQFNGGVRFDLASSGSAGSNISFTQAMTLDASGNLLVGTTSGSGKITTNTGASGAALSTRHSAGAGSSANWYSIYDNTSGTAYGAVFLYNGFANQPGQITYTSTTVSYTSNSDYRLKNTIAPMTGALEKVLQLNPVTYKWNTDGSDGQGFIAHELQAIVPDAVTGEKDAVDENGKPKYQGIDTSFLVATLTAALQELKALVDTQASTITTLTDRITALEAKP